LVEVPEKNEQMPIFEMIPFVLMKIEVAKNKLEKNLLHKVVD